MTTHSADNRYKLLKTELRILEMKLYKRDLGCVCIVASFRALHSDLDSTNASTVHVAAL